MFGSKYICNLLIVFFFTAYNSSNDGKAMNSAEEQNSINVTASDTVVNLETEFSAPVNIESEKYRIIQKGKYQPKSTDTKFIEGQNKEIETFLVTSRSFVESPACMYLANDAPIALFRNMNPKTTEDVAGILKNSTLVEVDSVFYNAVFIDSEEAPMSFEKWYELLDKDSTFFESKPLTYDVWYAIKINGKKYYTDYKLHNYIEYRAYIPFREQIFLICSQGTGYDGGYDRGYPDFYEVVVLEKPELQENKWKQIYRSPKLDMNNEGIDEYGISDYLTSEPIVMGPGDDLVINFGNFGKLIWNGKKLQLDGIKVRSK